MRYVLYFYAGYFIVPSVAAQLTGRPLLRASVLLTSLGILTWFGADPIDFKVQTIIPSGLGATLLIAAVASTGYRALNTQPLRFLGRISYSFYLLHWPVFYLTSLLALSHPTYFPAGFAGNMFIMLASIAFALWLSALSYRYVELPFIRTNSNSAQMPGASVVATGDTAHF